MINIYKFLIILILIYIFLFIYFHLYIYIYIHIYIHYIYTYTCICMRYIYMYIYILNMMIWARDLASHACHPGTVFRIIPLSFQQLRRRVIYKWDNVGKTIIYTIINHPLKNHLGMVYTTYPLINKHSYWKPPCSMGKSTIDGQFQ
jgi:hypothetical protein